MVISVFFSILGLSLGAGLIIDFVSVRDGLIIAPTVQKDQCCNVTAVDGLKDVFRKHPQGSCFCGVTRPETRLE